MRSFIKNNLSGGYNGFKAGNGDSILNIVFARILDLAVTDIKMLDPDSTGHDLRFGNNGRKDHIPGIILKTRTTIETRIEGLMTFKEGAINKPPDNNELKLRITNLLIEREKYMPKNGLTAGILDQEGSSDSIEENFMKKISRIINENIKSLDFDVGMLQDKIGISRVQLYRKVKALTGEYPSTIIHKHRMQRAANLIQGKAGNLAEISLSVGFTNPSYFSKRFKEFYGSSPKTFSNHPGSYPLVK
jgi:AraC-like DNA-binding protein